MPTNTLEYCIDQCAISLVSIHHKPMDVLAAAEVGMIIALSRAYGLMEEHQKDIIQKKLQDNVIKRLMDLRKTQLN